LPEEIYNVNPDEQWTPEELCEAGANESWNIDEYSDEGYMALKHLFLRLVVPKEHWEDCPYDKFIAIVKSKYQERLNEEE
jgi:hypothetical protein